MLNKDEILTRLQKGEDLQDINKEIQEVIKQAQIAYEKESAKIEQKRKMEHILWAIERYIREYVPSIHLTDSIVTPENIQKAIEIMDEIGELFNAVEDLGKWLEKQDLVSPVDKKKKNTDTILNDFLKEMGW